MSAATEWSVESAAGRFAGLAWPRPGAPRVLCLHGWLDNAASFLPLAPELEAFDVVALDLAGHGHSPHRPPGARYYFMDNLWDIDAVLDTLEWDACHLLGHSMGGALACVFAATAPERVRSMVLLDGLGPTSARPEQTVERLRKSRASVRKATGRLRAFPDLDAVVAARRSVSDLSEEAARPLVERSVSVQDGHYRWRTDPRLNWTSPSWLAEEQVLNILKAIEAPVLSWTALPLPRWIDPGSAKARLRAIRDIDHRTLDGHHHFHMEVPARIGPSIRDFLTQQERDRVPSQN